MHVGERFEQVEVQTMHDEERSKKAESPGRSGGAGVVGTHPALASFAAATANAFATAGLSHSHVERDSAEARASDPSTPAPP